MRGDVRDGETGLATMNMTWSVKPCDTRAIRVVVEMKASISGEVMYLDENAPLSGSVLVSGIKIRTAYTEMVTVYDAVTGEVIGWKSTAAAANPKPV